ncbi:MAG: acyl-CoA thioesterase [Gammaproteobacteria bacterium]|nr:acyl-CoA thioesterase [Gammaproteobacteria bacterium]
MASSHSNTQSVPLFKYEFTTRIHDIDAAGVVFFARNLYHVHDAYEAFLNQHEQSIATMLKSDFILPISHTEAYFKAPVFLNETITIEIFTKEIKEDEFILNYQFINQSERVCTTASTHHVCIDKLTQEIKKLPDFIRTLLK